MAFLNPDGLPDDENTRLGALHCLPHWAVVVADHCQMAVMVQSLPLAENLLMAKPPLRGNAPPIISVGNVPLACVMFNSNDAAGPVPIIPCDKEERLAFINNPLSARRELQRIIGVFGQSEYLLLQGRDGVCQEAQAGPGGLPLQAEGAISHPTKKPWMQETKPGRNFVTISAGLVFIAKYHPCS